MKFAFQPACIKILVVFVAAIVITGCMKHAPVDKQVSPLPPLAASPADKKIVVAKVNGVELSRYELVQMMNLISANTPSASSPESREKIEKIALDQLVLRELALQDAARQGLHVEPREIDGVITSLVGHKTEDYEDVSRKTERHERGSPRPDRAGDPLAENICPASGEYDQRIRG